MWNLRISLLKVVCKSETWKYQRSRGGKSRKCLPAGGLLWLWLATDGQRSEMAHCFSVSFPHSALHLLLAVSWQQEACRQTCVCHYGDTTVTAYTGHRWDHYCGVASVFETEEEILTLFMYRTQFTHRNKFMWPNVMLFFPLLFF